MRIIRRTTNEKRRLEITVFHLYTIVAIIVTSLATDIVLLFFVWKNLNQSMNGDWCARFLWIPKFIWDFQTKLLFAKVAIKKLEILRKDIQIRLNLRHLHLLRR